MSDHYYSASPESAHDVQQFTIEHAGRTLHFQSDAGVFSKGHLDKGSELLISALPAAFSGSALDLGCGWGAVGACMAAMWPQATITMTDVNERAVSLSQANLARNDLSATTVQGDGLAHLPGPFDLIATNPPIRTGKETIYRLFAESAESLREGGALYVVMRKQQGAESAQRYLQTLLREVEIIARGGGFRVMRGIK